MCVCGHVDDFMFAGDPQDERWKDVCKKIQERFRCGEWEKNNVVQCGVSIQRQDDGGFLLTQPEYVNQIDEVFMPKKRWQEMESPATASECQQMQSVLMCFRCSFLACRSTAYGTECTCWFIVITSEPCYSL